eukprot:14669212-Alexandrium_andersonii.AAC.1
MCIRDSSHGGASAPPPSRPPLPRDSKSSCPPTGQRRGCRPIGFRATESRPESPPANANCALGAARLLAQGGWPSAWCSASGGTRR